MSILKTDIKLMASERLTDYDDGGGEMTGTEVTDGEVNNLFPDISRLDRVYGRVSLRKCFLAVMTDNQDMYYGSHAIITDPPDDDNVHVTLFTTGDFYDERLDSKDHIESYVAIAQTLALRLLGDQLEGQRTIVAFQQPDGVLPRVSETLVLRNSVSGDQQFVRVQGVSTERAGYVHATYGAFTVDVVTIELSAALQYTFPGVDPTPYVGTATTRVHGTAVADAARYFGVSRLTEAANSGAMTLQVDSIYNQLVPTSQVETAVVDQLIFGSGTSMVASGADDSLVWSGVRGSDNAVIHLRSGLLPGSLALTIDGHDFIDKDGDLIALVDAGGYGGSIDYAAGRITLTGSGTWNQDVTLAATPAAAVTEAQQSLEILIEISNRAWNYTPNLKPVPAPGTLTVDYMALGNWYRLKDNGRGELVGTESGIGTGTIDYASGSMVLTVGALPDVGSSIIITWGTGIEATARHGAIDGDDVIIEHDLPDTGIEPGSIAIAWGGGAYTATDTGAGTLSGDAVGTISYGAGKIRFTPAVIPASGEVFDITYRKDLADSATVMDLTVNGQQVSFTIPNAPLRPGSVSLEWAVEQVKEVLTSGQINTRTITKRAHDDGSGNLIGAVGTIDYATGAVTMVACADYQYDKWSTVSYKTGGNFGALGSTSYMGVRTAVSASQTPPAAVIVTYQQDVAADWTDATDSLDAGALEIDLTPGTVEPIVAGSVLFALAGSFYYDLAGALYRDRDDATGAGDTAGSINYETGIATLNTYPQLANTDVTLLTLLTRSGGNTPTAGIFRLPGAPVRDGSLSVRANLPDGTLLSATAGTDGLLSADRLEGTIDSAVGVVRLFFGEMVTAAGNEAEPWYDADMVQEGQIWCPYGVLADTALYNGVIYSYLPLDADLIGIEPVRLPIDGRVPILRSGDVAVIHHTADQLLPDNLTAGQQIVLDRDNLSLVELRDQAGTLVDETLYTVALATGVVTMADPLDLSAYSQPLVAAHRIEDMVLISEAQINGLIRTVGPITHDFPADETQVSGALISGDLAARIVRQFTQKTWDNIWQNTRSGDDTTAKYDSLHYPIAVTNRGALAQRWCIKFTSATAFDVIGEKLGVIASGTTSSNVAPTNPATGVPYFTIDYHGWGTGWAAGNCLRFDTSAANATMWLARTTMPGPVEEPTDNFTLQIRGDGN
jgi:hypothetical protein